MGEERNNGGGETQESAVIGEIERPGEASSVPELLEFVASIERQEGFGEERIAQVASALKAALDIVLTRSYREQSGDVRITCANDPLGKLAIVITDKGEPFNILLSDVSFPGEESQGDRALAATARLIKKVIDNIEYRRAENENTLSFFVSAAQRGR